MTRTILALAAALVVGLAPFATSAEAGGCGGYRGFSKYSSYNRSYARDYDDEDDYAPRRSKSYAAKSLKTKAAAVAKAKATRPAEVATDESVTEPKRKVASAVPAKIPSEVASAESTVSSVVASAVAVAADSSETRELGCKRFVPAAGLTISVKCE